MDRIRGLVLVFVSMLAFGALAADKHDHKHDEHEGSHGGVVLEIGDHVAHVEVVHDQKAGKITLYLTDKDAKSALAIKDAPKINVKAEKGNKQIEAKAIDAKDGAASQFEATDDVLKADPLKGRIAITINEKKYNVELKDAHDHKH